MARFGPAGNGESFSAMGYRASWQAPGYLHRMGLTAYEYQCGRGVRLGDALAQRLRQEAEKYAVALSLHAPYYISLSSVDAQKRTASVEYILQSARAVDRLGGDRVVVHAGSCAKMPREQALGLALATLQQALDALDGEGLSHIRLCPETMGKANQLGTLEEVLAMCRLDERMLPCIDFGHLNARTFGGLAKPGAVAAVFDQVERQLGSGRMRALHMHFSKIEYTRPGGEKRHLTFADQVFGPQFEPVAEEIVRRGCHPVVICESAGTQAEDAAAMRDIYLRMGGQGQ